MYYQPVSQKTKNTKVFVFWFSKQKNKESRNTKKKNIFWVKAKHSPQSFFFGVLCFDLPQLAASCITLCHGLELLFLSTFLRWSSVRAMVLIARACAAAKPKHCLLSVSQSSKKRTLLTSHLYNCSTLPFFLVFHPQAQWHRLGYGRCNRSFWTVPARGAGGSWMQRLYKAACPTSVVIF